MQRTSIRNLNFSSADLLPPPPSLPHANPITRRLSRHLRPIQIRTAFFLALVGGIGTLAFATHAFTSTQTNTLNMLLRVTAAGMVITPALTTIVAAQLAATEQRDEPFQLLQLTPLSDRKVVWGYVWAAVLRSRLAIAVLVGLLPALIVAMMYLQIYAAATVGTQPFSDSSAPLVGGTFCTVADNGSSCVPRYLSEFDRMALVAGSVGVFLPLAALAVAMNVVGAMIGVGIALRWSSGWTAISLAPVVTVLATLMAGFPWLFFELLAMFLSPDGLFWVGVVLVAVDGIFLFLVMRTATGYAAAQVRRPQD